MNGQLAADAGVDGFATTTGERKKLAIYEVVEAVQSAVWINSLLLPVLSAVRAEGRPIELRPMWWAGTSAGTCKRTNPDGRIALSTKAIFWSKTAFSATYLHELSHCLLEQCEPNLGHGHDACFSALNLALLLRLDAINLMAKDIATSWANKMDFYDLQDMPYPLEGTPIEVWKPRAIGWSMRVAHELFTADLMAEKLAELIAKRYSDWCTELENEPAKIAQAQAAAAQAEAVAAKKRAIENAINLKRKNDLFLFQALFSLVTVALLSAVYFCVSR